MQFKLGLETYKSNDILIPNFDNYLETTDYFLSEDDFVQALQQLLHTIASSDLSSVCLYDIQTISEFFIQVDLTNFTLQVSNELIRHVNNCYSSTRFIVLPIKITFVNAQQEYVSKTFDFLEDNNVFENLLTAHSNLIIIDTQSHTIEYFEPHGILMMTVMGGVLSIDKYIEFCIKTTFPSTFYYTFINTAQNCFVGPQLIQNIEYQSGHCLAWSLYFITLRLLNYHLHKNTLQLLNEYIVTWDTFKLNSTIRKFITFAKESMFPKLQSHLVYDMNAMLTKIDSSNLEYRIDYLSSMFFTMNKEFSSTQMPLLFEELISYRKHPKFFDILQKHFLQNSRIL